ncbi:MAG TPA: SDR family oxidoreductase [Candidatus Polarisedimenticolaceae bacterium]
MPVVLITGCSSGIGRETARLFARRGWRVFASLRDPGRPEAEALRAEAAREGWTLETPHLDVTDDASVDAAVGAMLRATGGTVDAVVNNAGSLLSGPLEEIPPEALRAHLDTLVVGVHRVTRAVLPAMRARGRGRVVVVSSLAGRSATPILGAYHAAKFGVEGMAEAWRYELAPFGIDVAIVAPGPFGTELHRNERRYAAPGSPYAGTVAAYDRLAGRLTRGDAGQVAEAIFRASSGARPPLRRRVGPFSFVGGRLPSLIPDSWRERLLRLAFRYMS